MRINSKNVELNAFLKDVPREVFLLQTIGDSEVKGFSELLGSIIQYRNLLTSENVEVVVDGHVSLTISKSMYHRIIRKSKRK